MKKLNIRFQDIVPFAAFLVIFVFFTIASYSERTGVFRLLTVYNLNNLLSQMMQTIVIACGSLFVVAQGHMDMSVGVNLALSAVVGTWVSYTTGLPFLLIPTTMIVGLAVGLFNGFIVSKFKVPSFMLTLSMLIGVRGLVNAIQVKIGTQLLPPALSFLTVPSVRILIFIVILIVMAYIFEFTNAGRYSRSIGENETAAKFVGIPVNRMKVVSFALSGLLTGVAAVFSVAQNGSTTQMMGIFLEMRVVMAIFLGGVMVTGGASAKFYKILLGSASIEIIVNGLALIGKADAHISESVQGTLLLVILALSVFARSKPGRNRDRTDDTPSGHHSEELAEGSDGTL